MWICRLIISQCFFNGSDTMLVTLITCYITTNVFSRIFIKMFSIYCILLWVLCDYVQEGKTVGSAKLYYIFFWWK